MMTTTRRWLLCGVLTTGTAFAADPAFLSLKIGGKDVLGSSARKGFENSIECVLFRVGASAPAVSSGTTVTKPVLQPLVCRKLIDRASPALMKALSTGAAVSLVVKATRPSAKDPAIMETLTFNGDLGKVIDLRQFVLPPGTIDDPTRGLPSEEVTFAVASWSYTDPAGEVGAIP